MKKKVFVIVCAVLLVIIGTIVVKVRTDARNELAKEARSQKEKDAEALDDRINNPQTPEDYYEAFLADRITATTSRTGYLQKFKVLGFKEIKDKIGEAWAAGGWPSKLKMVSYCIVKLDDAETPCLILRFRFGYSYSDEYLDYVCVFKYMENGNLCMTGQMMGGAFELSSIKVDGEIKVFANGLIKETFAYQRPGKRKYNATAYYKMGTDNKIVDTVAIVYKYGDLKECIIPNNYIPEETIEDDYPSWDQITDYSLQNNGYELTVVQTSGTPIYWGITQYTEEFCKDNVYYFFTDKADGLYHDSADGYASFYKEHNINVITMYNEASLLKDVFSKYGYDYDLYLDSPEVEWIDIECPPWGPYN